MLELAAELKAIWFLVAAALGGVIWLVRLEGRLNTAIRDLSDLNRQINRLYGKTDKLDVIDKQVATMASMMRPEAVAEYHRSDERVKARLEVVESRVTELLKRTYQGG